LKLGVSIAGVELWAAMLKMMYPPRRDGRHGDWTMFDN